MFTIIIPPPLCIHVYNYVDTIMTAVNQVLQLKENELGLIFTHARKMILNEKTKMILNEKILYKITHIQILQTQCSSLVV